MKRMTMTINGHQNKGKKKNNRKIFLFSDWKGLKFGAKVLHRQL